MTTGYLLDNLGWRPHFAAQLDSGIDGLPARVVRVHRGRVELLAESNACSIDLSHRCAALGLTVGDWVLIDDSATTIRRRLEPFSVFRRRAAGTSGEIQNIAANVDTVFLVTSANRDFNVARLERYLALAHEAGAFPVIVITKADLAEDTSEYRSQAAKLSPGILIESLDARDSKEVAVLRPWCEPGQTVAMLGSSGVGKSTLINTLTGTTQHTFAVRDDDQRGRHTTTSRSMHQLQGGGWLIDTPGMRELQLVDVGEGLDEVFADIVALAASCRFPDCEHANEPGCAVNRSLESGDLEMERLRRYRKLLAEDRRNTETLAERRSRDKRLGRYYKSIIARKKKEKDSR